MSSICPSCEIEIAEDYITCQGFCNVTFHPRCCGMGADALEAVMKYHQVFWMCKPCTQMMNNIRFRNAARAAYESGQEHGLSMHGDTMQNLKSEILADLKAEIRSNFATLLNSNSFTPKSSRHVGVEPRFTKVRRLFDKAEAPIPNQKPMLLQGTGSTVSPSTEIETVPIDQPKFWLYLSRIARDVSSDQVSALAKKRLGTEDIQVTRLVAKGRDISTMTFVSFKIGMNADLKTKALSTSTWPKGVAYREFSDNRTGENFWRPNPLQIGPSQSTSVDREMDIAE